MFPFFALFGLVFVAVGGALALTSLNSARLGLRLLRARPATVSSLMSGMPGQRYFHGTVVALDETVTAPFSGRQAVVAGYEVKEEKQQYNASTKTHSTTWKTIDEGWRAVAFVLDDGSGEIRVDPAGARFVVGADETTRVAGGRRPPEHVVSFIERSPDVGSEAHGFDVGPFRLSTGDDRKYVERRLEVGDEVGVYGSPRSARGDVGQVNAVLDGGSPFVVADAGHRAAGWRVVGSSAVPALFGLVFVAVGLAVSVGTVLF